jgi:hypothetical protein
MFIYPSGKINFYIKPQPTSLYGREKKMQSEDN